MAKYHGGPRQQELCDWLAANDINPHAIPIDGDLTIEPGAKGARVIRYEAFVFGENEMPVLNERGTEVAVEKRTAPLVVEPPAWWEPFEKPTREQLTARAERVRALHRRNENTGTCEHCSAGDYPDYAVPFPCDTIRALGGEPTSAEQEEIKAQWSRLYGNNQTAHPVVEMHPTDEEATR